MMNTKFLCVATIMLCVICPVLAGFMMPTDQVERTGYTTGDPTNITAGLNNDVTSISGVYSSYLNNQFAVSENQLGMFWTPVGDSTTIPNNYPLLQYGTEGSMKMTGTVDLTSISWEPGIFGVILWGAMGSGTEIRSEGVEYSTVIYYPNTKLAFGFDSSAGMARAISNTLNVTTGAPDSFNMVTQYLAQETDANGKKLYVDTSKGLEMDSSAYTLWTNTQENTKVFVVVDSKDCIYHVHDKGFGRGSIDFSVSVDAGVVSVYSYSENEQQTVGSVTAYPKLLLEFNALDHKIVVTGLTGMNSFVDNLQGHLGSSVSMPYPYDTVHSFAMSYLDGQEVRYYVPYTEIYVSNTAVMNDVTFNASDYYPQGLWMAEMKNSGFFGDSITFTVNRPGETSTTNTYTVSNGSLVDVPLNGSPSKVDLSSMTIAVIPLSDGSGNALLINGQRYDTDSIPSGGSVQITYNGVWKMNTYLYPVESYTYSQYEWAAGTFNIGMETFCAIGLAAAILMGIVSGLCAFRYDVGGLAPLFISIMCAGVYITLLFNM